LGSNGHYPAIDILESVSRLSSRLSGKEQLEAARRIREALALHRQSRDLIELGAYVAGSNPALDAAIRARPSVLEFLRQDAVANNPLPDTLKRLDGLAALLP
jgi:flagellar biosynthesis/type III secretory pathway ATPase